MSSLYPGIVSTADKTPPGATFLPLESLAAHAYIADVSARVVLSQLYSNPTQDPLMEAHYVFPVPTRAAVCSFEMRTDYGRRLKGIVKGLTEAKADYEEAVREGKLAGLLQQFRQDVFVMRIGTIPPRTSVIVSLSYIMDLAEDDQYDTIRFHIPFHVGARYGAPPTSALYHGTAHNARVRITVEVEMASDIVNVSSPTHAIELMPEITSNVQGVSSHYACLKWVSMDTFLDKDFLLVVQANELDRPRCLAETLSPSDNPSSSQSSGGPTTALALTIVPRFDLPTLPAQEYIFLIDRSGSMHSHRIETAQKALKYLLRTLPTTSSIMFNIFSFGSFCTSLWATSQHYNESTLEQATLSIDMMQADMGGTEILGALTQVFYARSRTIPSSVFVLTDGEVYDTQTVVQYVRQEVASAPDSASLRIFSLGVGDGTTELSQGISDAGSGVCVMAQQTEDLILKAARFVNLMRVPTVEALRVEWRGLDQALQAPDPIPNISPGVRTVVTTIMIHDAPTHVVLTGRLSDGNTLEYRVPVVHLSPHFLSNCLDTSRGEFEIPPLLHTLAAHRYIQGLDQFIQAFDRGVPMPCSRRFSGLSPPIARELTQNLIVELGTEYQVASSLTAFVAIDTPTRPPLLNSPLEPSHRRPSRTNGSLSHNSVTHNSAQGHSGAGTQKNTTKNGHASTRNQEISNSTPKGQQSAHRDSLSHLGDSARSRHGQSHASSDTTQSTTPKNQRTSRRTPSDPSSHLGLSSNVNGPPDFFAHGTSVDTAAADEVVVLPDPLGGEQPIICTAPPLPQDSIYLRFPGRKFLSKIFRVPEHLTRLGNMGLSAWKIYQQMIWGKDTTSVERLLEFSALQTAEGSFPLNDGLFSRVGIAEADLRSSMPRVLVTIENGEEIWGTAVAVAFFRTTQHRYKEVWEALEDKARSFASKLLAEGTVTFEEMVDEARKLFPS